MVLAKKALAAVMFLIVVGQAQAAFNDVITGARPQGLGGAFVAVADDANALYWNPAGLTQLGTAELTFMHANEYDITVGPGFSTDFVGFANWPMELGCFGLAVYQQGSGKVLQERTILGSYALSVGESTSVGLNVKYLTLDPSGTQVTADDAALSQQSTVSFDLGGLQTVTPAWKLGFLVRNVLGEIGTSVKENLPRTYRVGSAYRFEDVMFLDDAITWSLDLFTKDDINDAAGIKILAASGIEYTFDERVSVRLGVNRGDFAAGLGFGHPESGIFVDYAYANDTAGNTHRISATYRFGGPPGDIHVVHHQASCKARHKHDRDESCGSASMTKAPARSVTETSSHSITNPRIRESTAKANASRRSIARSQDLDTGSLTGEANIGVSPIQRSGSNNLDRELKDFLKE